ncbi:hypothetical protein PQR66_39980, partial [Paraburkholderia agricolaris]
AAPHRGNANKPLTKQGKANEPDQRKNNTPSKPQKKTVTQTPPETPQNARPKKHSAASHHHVHQR